MIAERWSVGNPARLSMPFAGSDLPGSPPAWSGYSLAGEEPGSGSRMYVTVLFRSYFILSILWPIWKPSGTPKTFMSLWPIASL